MESRWKNSTRHLTATDKQMLFWASFLALTAAGVGFVFRVMIPDMWVESFQVTKADVGVLTGAALWPIAITMILFSLLVDKIGYKVSMFFRVCFTSHFGCADVFRQRLQHDVVCLLLCRIGSRCCRSGYQSVMCLDLPRQTKARC